MFCLQTTINRLRESGHPDENELRAQQRLLDSYRKLLNEHKATAQACQEEYKRQRRSSQETWKRISEIQERGPASVEEEQELQQLQAGFVGLLDADYQMGKLLSHWGYSVQPGSSYYKQKLSFDVFGIVFHGTPSNSFYSFHEGAAAAKNSDHTISCLNSFIEQSVTAWVRHLVLVLDNAQVNKNQFVVGWMGEMVKSGRLDSIRLFLIIPGHTKFGPDEVFPRIAHSFYRNDVFSAAELLAIAGQYGEAHGMDATSIFKWREVLPRAYKPPPHIKDLHDFCWKAGENGAPPVLSVRKLCY